MIYQRLLRILACLTFTSCVLLMNSCGYYYAGLQSDSKFRGNLVSETVIVLEKDYRVKAKRGRSSVYPAGIYYPTYQSLGSELSVMYRYPNSVTIRNDGLVFKGATNEEGGICLFERDGEPKGRLWYWSGNYLGFPESPKFKVVNQRSGKILLEHQGN